MIIINREREREREREKEKKKRDWLKSVIATALCTLVTSRSSRQRRDRCVIIAEPDLSRNLEMRVTRPID